MRDFVHAYGLPFFTGEGASRGSRGGNERPGRSHEASEIPTGGLPHVASSVIFSNLAWAARAQACQRGI
jgi:hypothetical protein